MSHHHHCAAASSSRFFTQWQCSMVLTRTSHRASSSGTSWTGTGWRPPPSRSQGLPCRCQSPPGHSPWRHLEGTGNHGCDVQQSRRLVWVMWPEVKSSDGSVGLHISNLSLFYDQRDNGHLLQTVRVCKSVLKLCVRTNLGFIKMFFSKFVHTLQTNHERHDPGNISTHHFNYMQCIRTLNLLKK